MIFVPHHVYEVPGLWRLDVQFDDDGLARVEVYASILDSDSAQQLALAILEILTGEEQDG